MIEELIKHEGNIVYSTEKEIPAFRDTETGRLIFIPVKK
jgi:hypothetical protein